MSPTPPSQRLERQLAADGLLVAGMDEVGRGALAGPVCVGVVVVGESMPPFPVGLTDSKLLSAKAREALVQPIREWSLASGVGMASAAEVDQSGIIGALRLAGWRALAVAGQQLTDSGLPSVGAVLLDGIHDWLTHPEPDLLDESVGGAWLPVTTRKKADLECASVAAASVLAKVERDRQMVLLEDPGYGWAKNKGYASAEHQAGLGRLGASAQHRKSWRLPGLNHIEVEKGEL